VKKDKVGGVLAVSRAFGDSELGQWVRADDPYLNQTPLTSNDTHLILACDGLWDVVSDQEACDIVSHQSNAQDMCYMLLRIALEKGTTDNVSIVVVCL